MGDVLLTGATGFVGRHLTRALLVEGESAVSVLVRSERRIDDVLGGDRERLRVFLGDLGSEAGAPALPLSGLGDRLAGGLSAGDAARAGDILEGTATVVAETERERLRGGAA